MPGFTIDNYRQVVTTPLYRTYALNTFLIAAPTALLSVIGGYVLAYFLAFRARRSRRFLLIAIVIALMGSYLALDLLVADALGRERDHQLAAAGGYT